MLICKLISCLLFTIFTWNFASSDGNAPMVVSPLGQIRGSYMKTLTGRQFSAFRGIPYVKPPLGQLRFKPPERLTEPWTPQPLDASKDGSPCPQYEPFLNSVFGQEDCLFINVYTPEVPVDKSGSKSKPVLIFIHGGGFNFGSGVSTAYGPKRLLDHGVILVTFNYRINLFGFLSTGDEISPGNYGLLDQVEALRWVQENIEAFGGDPDKVTIFGESAGGASVTYHLLSELSSGLFHGAIVMSGSALATWAHDYNPILITKKLVAKVNCAKSTSEEIVECLRNLSVEDLVETFREFGERVIAPFRPTLDGKFLTDHPLNLIKKGQIVNQVPLIVGLTADEGVFIYGFLYGNSIPIISEKTVLNAISHMQDVDEEVFANKFDLFKNLYFRDMDKFTPETFQRHLFNFLADALMIVPIYYDLQLYLNHGIKPYVYIYDYVTNHSSAKIFGFKGDGKPTHIDDVFFLLDSQLIFPDDYDIANDDNENKFLNLWLNFARHGNPNVGLEENSVKWIPASKDNLHVCHLDDPIKLRDWKVDPELIDLWMTKVPELMHKVPVVKEEL